jgi:hypothetical protein
MLRAHSGNWWILIVAFILTTVLTLSGCAGLGDRLIGASSRDEYYRPPEVDVAKAIIFPTPTLPIAVDTPTAVVVIPTPSCTNYLKYLEDVSIPDGTVVRPGETLDKQWRVENTGTCNWDGQYRLLLIAGQSLGTRDEGALFPARSGTQAVIRLVFTAPDTPDTYRSAWQAHDAQGNAFGEPFFIEVVVQP